MDTNRKDNRTPQPEPNPAPKIEGELTLEELSEVSGGLPAGPIINGKSYSPLKSRFGKD